MDKWKYIKIFPVEPNGKKPLIENWLLVKKCYWNVLKKI